MAIDVEAVYRKYGPMVMRRCRQLLKDEHKALDAMQDTFVKLLQYQGSALMLLHHRVSFTVLPQIYV